MNDVSPRRGNWPSTIVFDLDGTLVDTAGDIATALNAVLARRDLAPFAMAEVIDFIGDGISALLKKAFSARGITLDDQELASILSDFRSNYGRCLLDMTRPYAGVVELVDRLLRRGVRLGVCTNKEEAFATRIIEGLGLQDRFTVVVGGMPGRPSKPSPLPLVETISRLGGEPRNAVMVGDSAADIKCAQNAGVKFIGVSFGYSRIPLTSLGAENVIDRYSDFEEACNGLLVKT